MLVTDFDYHLPPELSVHYDDSNVDPLDLWQKPYMHVHTDDDAEELAWLKNRQNFTIIRKMTLIE